VRKEIIHYVEMNEYLVQFYAKDLIPNFKRDRALQYKWIMREFARIETENSLAV